MWSIVENIGIGICIGYTLTSLFIIWRICRKRVKSVRAPSHVEGVADLYIHRGEDGCTYYGVFSSYECIAERVRDVYPALMFKGRAESIDAECSGEMSLFINDKAKAMSILGNRSAAGVMSGDIASRVAKHRIEAMRRSR